MARIAVRRVARRGEPTIALINIVFLMLIFFLVAGTLARPLDRDLKLVSATRLEGRAPPDALVVFADGRLAFRYRETTPAAHLAHLSEESGSDDTAPDVRIVPDRELPAADLVQLMARLRAEGAARIFIVTERGLE